MCSQTLHQERIRCHRCDIQRFAEINLNFLVYGNMDCRIFWTGIGNLKYPIYHCQYESITNRVCSVRDLYCNRCAARLIHRWCYPHGTIRARPAENDVGIWYQRRI